MWNSRNGRAGCGAVSRMHTGKCETCISSPAQQKQQKAMTESLVGATRAELGRVELASRQGYKHRTDISTEGGDRQGNWGESRKGTQRNKQYELLGSWRA